MAEPPAKRARRVDSSAMWDLDDRQTNSPEPSSEFDRSSRRESDVRRDGPRDDRRYRSRSRDKRDRRRERSRSRDRRDRDRERRERDKSGRGMRDRERSTSRDRYYDKRGYPSKGDRLRERSRSPIRKGTRDRSRTPPPRGRKNDRRDPRPQPSGPSDFQRPSKDEMDVDDEEAEGDDVDAMMRKHMGFSRFRSTKNTKVPGNDIYGVRKEKKTQYRQYMNRIGGFNRPLSP